MFSSISFEFENDKIKIIEGTKKGNQLLVLNCLSIRLPQNCIDDGKIININVVYELICRNLMENSIKTKKASFLINSNMIISRKIELPLLKNKKQTKSMIYYNLSDVFSGNIVQYMFIYKIVDIYIKDGVKYASYIVSSLPIELYNQYVKLSKMLKLNLSVMDISSNSLEEFKSNKKEIINAFIKINKNSINFSVINNGINEFNRIYYINNQDLSFDKVAEDSSDYLYSKSVIEHMNSNTFNQWTDIILKYLKYYYSINKSKNNIDKIYVYGDECYKGIDKELSNELDMKVELIDNTSNITISNQSMQNKFNIREYLNCCMVLLYNNPQSNFLKDAHKYHKLRFNVGVAVFSIFTIFTIFMSLRGIVKLYKTISMENQIKTMKLFIESEENIKLNNNIEETKIQVAKLEQYLEQGTYVCKKIANEDWVNSNILIEINYAVPEGTIVNNIYIEKTSIQLMCQSPEISEVSLLLSNLRNVEFINNVYVPVIDYAENSRYSYQVLCNVMVDNND